MEKHNEKPADLLHGLAGGGAFVDELLKQIDDFSHSIWQSVAVETENHLARAHALEQLANTIERVTNAVLSDGQPVETEKIEAARARMGKLRDAAEKMRSAAVSIGAQAEIKEARLG